MYREERKGGEERENNAGRREGYVLNISRKDERLPL